MLENQELFDLNPSLWWQAHDYLEDAKKIPLADRESALKKLAETYGLNEPE